MIPSTEWRTADQSVTFAPDATWRPRNRKNRHTTPASPQPRHAWTNGFVERLQGTILHEHWRIAFRRRYFRKRFQLQASLDGFLWFYNFDRPHQGYRTEGHAPAQIFWGAINHEVRQEA